MPTLTSIASSTNLNRVRSTTTRTKKLRQLLIITPAVSIDNNDNYRGLLFKEPDDMNENDKLNYNGNRLDNGKSSARHAWRLCTVICSAVKCFRSHQQLRSSNLSYERKQIYEYTIKSDSINNNMRDSVNDKRNIMYKL